MTLLSRKPLARLAACFLISAAVLFPLPALTVGEAMDAALLNDSSLADAQSALSIAGNNLFKSASLYGSDLSLSGSLKGESDASSASATPSAGTDTGTQKTIGAALTVPLAKWISVGVSGTTDTETSTGSLSLTLTPLADADTQAEVAWNKAVVNAQNAVRNTLLSVRKEYRSVLTAQAEYAYRKAAVQTAQNELSRVQYLVELGSARKSGELTVYSDLMDAQGELDNAENNLSLAKRNLSNRTGLDTAVLADFESPGISDARTLVDEEGWTASSADMAAAKISLDSVVLASRQAASLPGLTLAANVTDTKSWTVSAKVSFSPDLLFKKTEKNADENLAVQSRAYAATGTAVRTAFRDQLKAVEMAERNYGNANRFVESAKVSYTETQLLLERGETSRSSLDSANENLLSAKYQLEKATEALENARDQLDASWQLQLGGSGD